MLQTWTQLCAGVPPKDPDRSVALITLWILNEHMCVCVCVFVFYVFIYYYFFFSILHQISLPMISR